MKKYYILLLSLVLASGSCTKETNIDNNNPETDIVSVQGIINTTDGFDIKTDYSINEGTKTATFSWLGKEKIGRLTYDGAATTQHKIYTSEETADIGDTQLTFTGAYDSQQTEYAVYPSKDATNGAQIDWYSASTTIRLWIGENLKYDKDHPFEGIVPMLGKLDGTGKFIFNPITGILAVRVAYMPATATKVIISSNNKYISRGFRYSSSDVGYLNELEAIYTGGLQLEQSYSGNRTQTKNFSFTAGTLDENATYTFYFPIPAGVLNNGTTDRLTITIANGDTPIYSRTTSTPITIEKGKITRLPAVSPYIVAASIGGYSDAIEAEVTSKTDGVEYVKFYAATDLATAKSNVGDGTSINTTNTPTAITAGFGASGYYYIAYQGYDSSDNPLAGTTGTLHAYYLSSTDKLRFCNGQITDGQGKYYTNNSTPAGSASTDLTITMERSNDPVKGNIKLTEFDGFYCNSAPTSAKATQLKTLFDNNNSGWGTKIVNTYSSGYPMYGIYIPDDSGADNLEFASPDDTGKAFFYYVGTDSKTYSIRFLSSDSQGGGFNATRLRLRLNYTSSGYYLSTSEIIKIRWFGNNQAGSNYVKDFVAIPVTP